MIQPPKLMIFSRRIIALFMYFAWMSALFSADAIPHVVIPFLDCSAESVAGGNVGVRPIGVDGINFDVQELSGKQVFFNTGHGGSGVILAPGCAMEAIHQFEKRHSTFDKSQPIAVIGSGYSGLLIAEFLTRKGYIPKIYADKMPEKNYMYNGTSCVTSLVAAGYWMPYGINISDRELFEKLANDSWQYYYEQSSSLPGISMRDAYEVSEEDPIQDPLLIGLLGKSDQVTISIEGYEQYTQAWHYRTLLIDGNLLLNYVYENLQTSGVVFEKKRFKTIADIEALEEGIIFNCSGFGSRDLFQDRIEPASGQLVYLKDKEFPYFLRGRFEDVQFAFIQDQEEQQ